MIIRTCLLLLLASQTWAQMLSDSAMKAVTIRLAEAHEWVVASAAYEWNASDTVEHTWMPNSGWTTDIYVGGRELDTFPTLNGLRVFEASVYSYGYHAQPTSGIIPSPTYWVAFDNRGDRYRLRGFGTCESEFKRLARNTGLRGSDTAKFIELAELYFACTRPIGCWGRGGYRLINTRGEATQFIDQYVKRSHILYPEDPPSDDDSATEAQRIPARYIPQIPVPEVILTDSAIVVTFVVAEPGTTSYLTRVTTTISPQGVASAVKDLLWTDDQNLLPTPIR